MAAKEKRYCQTTSWEGLGIIGSGRIRLHAGRGAGRSAWMPKISREKTYGLHEEARQDSRDEMLAEFSEGSGTVQFRSAHSTLLSIAFRSPFSAASPYGCEYW